MAVQEHGLDLGQDIELAIQIAPAGLDNADVRVREVVDGTLKKIDRRNEIGIKNGDEFASGSFQSLLQSAGFEAVAVSAVAVFNRVARGHVFVTKALREGVGLVGGIVQNLNLQQFARIVDLGRLLPAGAPPRSARCKEEIEW